MKKNNKGFMLAEVVVTSTILLVIMVSLFFTFNKIYSRYNAVTAYKNIDGMYALDNFMEYIFNEREDDNINNIISKVTEDYLFIIENSECNNIINNDYCTSIKEGYNIVNLIIVRQREESVEKLLNDINTDTEKYNNTFRDYLNYIKKYYALWKNKDDVDKKVNDYNKNSYLLIVEFKTTESEEKDNIFNYSSLELR
ncbi:MAG: hypothetical protein IJI49_05565 [Bacilli bacterium]|nr:hypothetical protein [Bacilli bacterium]